MRNRKLSPTGDYSWGNGQLDYLINSPEAVAQAVQTSLLLWLGEWYLDLNAGVPYLEGILGKHTQDEANATLIDQIYQVQGVTGVTNFTSVINPNTRRFDSITAVLETIYGQTQLEIQNVSNF